MAPRKKIEQTLFTTWNRDPEHLGPWLDEEAVAALLSLSEDEVEQLRQNWKLIAVAGADGSWRWHLSRALPQRDEQGRIIRWLLALS